MCSMKVTVSYVYDTRSTLGLVVHSLSYLDKLILTKSKMDDLLSVMQIIDRNADKFAEGDYLQVCNFLKKAYNKRSDPVYFFDYENFATLPFGSSEYEIQYFYDHYFDKALNFDSDFIQGQIQYLRKELYQNQPIQRISKTIRESVTRHYSIMYGAHVEDINTNVVTSMCRSYIQIENDFRRKYRDAIEKRIEWLEQADDRLDDM